MALKFGRKYKFSSLELGDLFIHMGRLCLNEGDFSPAIIGGDRVVNHEVHIDIELDDIVIYVGSGDDLLEVIQSKLKGGAT